MAGHQIVIHRLPKSEPPPPVGSKVPPLPHTTPRSITRLPQSLPPHTSRWGLPGRNWPPSFPPLSPAHTHLPCTCTTSCTRRHSEPSPPHHCRSVLLPSGGRSSAVPLGGGAASV